MDRVNTSRWTGLSITIILVILWGSSLGWLLQSKHLPWFATVLGILGHTFLQTGLFVLAHDAMHVNLVPHQRTLNHSIGRCLILLYAGLSYDRCCENHYKHHRIPGQASDPDFHTEGDSNPFHWYVKFMQEYLSLSQLARLFMGLSICMLCLGVSITTLTHLLLFELLPLWLSSLQLFWFGTYLPHRHPPLNQPHQARSSDYPVWLSFLTCYHFGYHWEHHEYPRTPWYQLPDRRPQHIDNLKPLSKHFTNIGCP
ncbi:MAG: hypothetical protein B0A82_22750 [Alkalinema sp. CACIAM 70d]|nr:MAG: hypothetical protein B0A82_22750 [Alkalinema sp. CACIAM 70d]